MITEDQLKQWTTIHEYGASTLRAWYQAAYDYNQTVLRQHDSLTNDWRERVNRPDLEDPAELEYSRWWINIDNDVRVVIIPSMGMYGSWGAELPVGVLTLSIETRQWVTSLWDEWRSTAEKREADARERDMRDIRRLKSKYPDEFKS